MRSFSLMKKNQKIKNAGSPPGGIQPTAPGRIPCKFPFPAANRFINASFTAYFLSAVPIEAAGLRPGAERPDKTPGGIGFVLNFWFFLFKQKER